MALIQDGSGGGGILAVDTVSNAARVTFYDTDGNPILYPTASQVEPSAQAGLLAMGLNNKTILPQRLDRLGSQASANILPLLNESFDGTILSTQRWSVSAATMAVSQATASGLNFNSGAIVTANTGYLIRSARPYLKCMRQPLCSRTRAKVTPIINAISEYGFGDVSSATGSNNTGAYWQVTAAGAVIPVVEFNTAIQTGTDIRAAINALGITNFYDFDITIEDESVLFVCSDSSTGNIVSSQSIALASTGARLLSSTQISYFARLYITGTAAITAPALNISDLAVWSLDSAANVPLSHLMAGQGRGLDVNPLSGAQLAQWANSAEPASAVLSNTTPSYSGSLGGKFQFAPVAGATTDYNFFAYSVPAGTNLFITGIDIEAWNTGAASGGSGPLVLQWGIAVGMLNNAIASATSRVGIGAQNLPGGSPIGYILGRISKSYQTPLFCPAGRYLAIILRIPIGTVVASEIIQGMINFEGYFA